MSKMQGVALSCLQLRHLHQIENLHLPGHSVTAAMLSDAMKETSLTFWRRNYFFLILAHPVYKM